MHARNSSSSSSSSFFRNLLAASKRKWFGSMKSTVEKPEKQNQETIKHRYEKLGLIRIKMSPAAGCCSIILNCRTSVLGCIVLTVFVSLVWSLRGYDLRSSPRTSISKMNIFFEQQERKSMALQRRMMISGRGGGDDGRRKPRSKYFRSEKEWGEEKCRDIDASADGKLSVNEITWSIQKRVKAHMSR